MESKSLVSQKIVMPLVNADEALKAWKEYQNLKAKIVDENDIQEIGEAKFLKKSYWRKIATFFNLSIEKVDEGKEQIGKTLVWHMTMKATAENGRSTTGCGSCDIFEKAKKVNGVYLDKYGKLAKPKSIHDVRSTAETRATNRAISNLVGGGEVSAEEVQQDQQSHLQKQQPVQPQQKQPYQPKPAPVQPASNGNKHKCSGCGIDIPEMVDAYSNEHYGAGFCVKCQKIVKASQQNKK